MTSNRLFRAATYLHCSELASFSRSHRHVYASSSIFRRFSSRKSSQTGSSNDLFRVQLELSTTLRQFQQIKSGTRQLAANALMASRKEREEIEEEESSKLFVDAPSTSSGAEKERMRQAALRQQFRSRLHTYLQACVLVGLQRGEQVPRNTRKIFLEAAHSSLRMYANMVSSGRAKRSISVDDPELFNTVLFGWIHAIGDIRGVDIRQRCLNLWKLMKALQIHPNEGTLAAFYLLHKIGPEASTFRQSRNSEEFDPEETSRVVDELMGSVVCTRNFLSDPRLNEDDREVLTSLLNLVNVQNDFSNSINPSARYRQSLLKSLNEPYGGLPLTSLMDGASQEAHARREEAISKDGPYSEILSNRRQLLRDFAMQLEREKRGVVVVPSAFATASTKLTLYDHVFDELQDLWKSQLLEKFEEQKHRQVWNMENRVTFGRINIAPFLCLLKPQDYVDVMFDEAYRLSELSDCHGVPLKILCNDLGKKLMGRIKVELAERYGIISKLTDTYEHYVQYFMDWPKYRHLNHREFWKKCASELHPLNPSLSSNSLTCENDWLLHELGEFLYEIIVDSLKVPASLTEAVRNYKSKKTIGGTKMVDAFFKALSSYNIRSYSEIRAHSTLTTLKQKINRRELRFVASEMPMICPPIPWHRHDRGQLLIKSIDLIRLEPDGAKSLQRTNRIVAKAEDVYPVIDSLNILGSTPWKINQPVLDVMLEVFRGDGNMKLDIPVSQGKLPPMPYIPKIGISQEEKAALMKKRQEMKKMQAEMYSLWCTAHYRFSLANHFREKVLWFPHNVDFRGRTYPVPPYLNHMGDDICRGMMRFAKGRPLGKDGLRWLKIHCINLTGLKKRESVDERAKYADEIIEDIFDSARNPLGGRKWWMQSEEPWQTLAVCMEIEKAMRMKNPEEYVCYVAVHQDGSCNGLQHYAALGRDKQGAEQVNLHPASAPQDVYSAIAALIEEKRAKDAESGLEIAKILEGFVRRKVIKQTVMTTVYGVTRYGGRAQVGRQLKDIDDFPQQYVFQGSMYLVERLFESIGEIFVTARQIQDWFVKSSGLISGELGKTVEWVTPLGFPVAQPYFKPISSTSTFAPEDRLSDSSARPFFINIIEKPNTYKQKNAFPPNYIHSLDSTHMMLTSLHCQRQGLTYAAVHDSFWTHPCTIGDMNRICRDQFVALHSQTLLNDLSRFFVRHYIDPELRKVEKMKNQKEKERRLKELARIKEHFESLPQLGVFDLKSVKGSVYFFS